MSNYYNEKYRGDSFYWGRQPSLTARTFLQKFPPHEGQELLDIGCGEGRDSIFFARNGYQVTGFDFSDEGISKATAWADALQLSLELFQADIQEYRLAQSYDVVYSSGALQYVPPQLRKEILSNYKDFTRPGGVHVFMVPVCKPFIVENPGYDPLEQDWISGEILTYYADWKIEFFTEEIRDDEPGYQWALNKLIAREPTSADPWDAAAPG